MDEISLRDYFIAHAPAEPQRWFRPKMNRPRPTHGPYISDDGMREYKYQHEASKMEGDEFYDPNEEARKIWDQDFRDQKLIQWPAAWADAMLIARKIKHTYFEE